MRYPHSPIRTVPQHRAGRTPGAPTRDLGEQGTDTGLQGGGDRGHGAGDEMAEGRTNCWSCTKSFQGNVLLQHVHLTMTCATWGRPHGDMDHMHHGSMSWGGAPKGPGQKEAAPPFLSRSGASWPCWVTIWREGGSPLPTRRHLSCSPRADPERTGCPALRRPEAPSHLTPSTKPPQLSRAGAFLARDSRGGGRAVEGAASPSLAWSPGSSRLCGASRRQQRGEDRTGPRLGGEGSSRQGFGRRGREAQL